MKKEVATKVELLEGGNTFKQGDEITLVFQIREHDKSIMDLTNATVEVLLSDGKYVVLEKIARVEDNKIYVDFTEEDGITGHGQMLMEFQITQGEIIRKFPSDGFQEIRITPTLDDIEFGGVPYLTFEMFVKEYEKIVADTKAEMSADVTALQGGLSKLKEVVVSIDNFPIQTPETDDTARINRAISYIESLGGGELTLTSGTYNVSTPTTETQNAVVLKSNVSIRGIGEVILKLAPNNLTNYAIIHIQNCDNVSVKNIKVIGESDQHLGTSGQWGMGFNIKESTNIVLDTVQAENCWGDGLYLGTITFTPVINNENIIIKNSHFKGRRNATSFISLKNGLFENCIFSDANGTLPMAGIDIEPNSAQQIVDFVTIRNCEFRNNKSVGFTTAHVKDNVRNIKIIDTKFIDNAGFSFSGEQSNVKNLELKGCTFVNSMLSSGDKNSGSPSSTVKGADNVTIDGNTFINSGKITVQKNTVTGELSKNITVSNNKFIDSVGLEIRSGKNIKVNDNFIIDFTNFGIAVNKIDAVETKEIMIESNQIYGSKGGSSVACGIRLTAGDEITVKDNICRKDDANLMIRGIAIEAETGQVILAGNDCKDGGSYHGILNNGKNVYMYQNRDKDGTWRVTANKIDYGTEPPTTGTWNKMDKRINTDPFAGGYEGWLCVESGTFGTATEPEFRPFGLISE